MKLSYLKELDGVRGIAALMIMNFHFFQHLEVVPGSLLAWIRKFSFFGQTGVTLFFVLSGFLITRILLHTKSYPNYFKSFFARRLLRIFPIYYLFLVVFYWGVPFIFEGYHTPFYKQWTFWIYLQDFPITFNWPYDGPFHYWSLAVEEHFYLFWPFAVYYLSEKKLVHVIYAIIGVSILVRILLSMNNYEPYFFTFTNFDSLAMGGLLAILEKRQNPVSFSKKRFIQLFFICLLPALFLWFVISGDAIPVAQWTKVLIISIIYYSILGYLLTAKETSTILNKVLRLKFFQFTGKISYGLYVYHLFCFSLMDWHFRFHYVLLNFILGFMVTYAVATLSYYFIESHFLKLKKYFNYGTINV